MSRYIDADKLMSEFHRYAWDTEDLHIDLIEDIVNDEPTADVRENVKGEWEEIEVVEEAYDISGVKTWASKMKCDQCRFTAIAIEGHFSQYNFCPNCGADMRGDQT